MYSWRSTSNIRSNIKMKITRSKSQVALKLFKSKRKKLNWIFWYFGSLHLKSIREAYGIEITPQLIVSEIEIKFQFYKKRKHFFSFAILDIFSTFSFYYFFFNLMRFAQTTHIPITHTSVEFSYDILYKHIFYFPREL